MKNQCNGCGLCCKLFYINLSKGEYESGKFETMFGKKEDIKDFKMAESCGANLLAKNDDGSCIYLENNKCMVHSTRPQVCRKFFCTTKAKKFAGMVEIIKNRDVDSGSSVKKG